MLSLLCSEPTVTFDVTKDGKALTSTVALAMQGTGGRGQIRAIRAIRAICAIRGLHVIDRLRCGSVVDASRRNSHRFLRECGMLTEKTRACHDVEVVPSENIPRGKLKAREEGGARK